MARCSGTNVTVNIDEQIIADAIAEALGAVVLDHEVYCTPTGDKVFILIERDEDGDIVYSDPSTGDILIPNVDIFPCMDPAVLCDPFIATFPGDDLSTEPFNILCISKKPCCALTIECSAGTFTLGPDVSTFCTEKFDCPITLTDIAIVDGDCELSDVTVTIQRTG